MKTKITKIFLLTLTLALAIGMAVGFTASAEGEAAAESVAIVSQKIDYAGTTHLYFAVKYENVENPEKIALNVSYVDSEGNAKEVTITDSEEVTLKDSKGNDVTCRTFRTPGVDAKSFTHKFVATAVTAAGTKSAEKTYSVTEYCLEWLTYIATQAEPTAEQLKIKDACEATLAYGTKIQALLDYYPAENDYPENYSYIVVDGGTANGKEKALVLNGTTVTLAATAGAPAAWSCTALDGTVTQLTESTFTANGSCIIAPINGKYFSDTSYTGTRLDYDKEGTAIPAFQSGASYATLTNVDGNLVFDKNGGDTSSESTFRWVYSASTTATTPVYIFEADMKFDDLNATTFGWLSLDNQGYKAQISFNHSANDVILYYGSSTSNGVTINEGEWYNIRFELDFSNNRILFCVNNEVVHVAENVTFATSGSSMARFALLTKELDGNITFDNVFIGLVEDCTPIPATPAD